MKMRGGEEYYWLSELCVRRDLTSKFNNFCKLGHKYCRTFLNTKFSIG